MTKRLSVLLTILCVSLIALVAQTTSADEVIEINNQTVADYVQQPCYDRAQTRVEENKGVTTWCIVNDHLIMCTSKEPVWCEPSK